MKSMHVLGAASLLGLALSPLLTACGGSGGPGGHVRPVCSAGPQTGMAGRWHLEGEYLEQVPGKDDVFVAPGLEGLALDLEHAFRDPDSCVELYVARGPALETASGVGSPSTLFAFFAPPAAGQGTGGFGGLYYLPDSDVSVDVQAFILPPNTDYTTDAMVLECEFEVYPGHCIVVGTSNIPDWDDDGDGEIDEADELEPEDLIDPDVIELCHGRMRLTATRAGAAVALAAPRVRVEGRLAEAGAERVQPLLVSFALPSDHLLLDAGELELDGRLQRVRARVGLREDGSFLEQLALDGGAALLEGRLLDGETLTGRLRLAGEGGERRAFAFEADLAGAGD